MQDARLTSLYLLAFVAGTVLLWFNFSSDHSDWVYLLDLLGFPGKKLGQRGRSDLAIFRNVLTIVAILLMVSSLVMWRYRYVVTGFSRRLEAFLSAAAQVPLVVPLSLTLIILVKTVLQLSLHFSGFIVFAGDDFGRTLKADYWLQHLYFEPGRAGWFGELFNPGGTWVSLPFPEYLFGIGLFLHRELYLTPKIMNLVLSGVAVIIVYYLGRELFGRRVGLLTALLFALQPWSVWIGISGMTFDMPSIMMTSLFFLFLFRWLETDQSRALLAAAACLFVANGFRYENWLFSVVFSLVIVISLIWRWRQSRLTLQATTVMVSALIIANAFPVIWMSASYYVLGSWLPSFTVAEYNYGSVKARVGFPILVLSSFPFEVLLSIGGIILLWRSDSRQSLHIYLSILITAFLLFALIFQGTLIKIFGIPRYFLPYIVGCLPFAGLFFARMLKPAETGRVPYLAAGCMLLIVMLSFGVVRAFNYYIIPSSNDAVYTGSTIHRLEELGNIPRDGRILLERGEGFGFQGIVALANKPERFVLLEQSEAGKACDGGFQTQACKETIDQGKFSLVVLSSQERVASFEEMFKTSAWQIGKYYVFEIARGDGNYSLTNRR